MPWNWMSSWSSGLSPVGPVTNEVYERYLGVRP